MKFLLLQLASVAILLSSCATIKPVEITGIENFQTLNPLSEPEFSFGLGIKNPNRYGVTLKKSGVEMLLGDSLLASVSTGKNHRIAGNSSLVIPLKLYPSMKMLKGIFAGGIRSMFSDLKNDQLVVKGEITVRKFIFRKKLSFREKVKF